MSQTGKIDNTGFQNFARGAFDRPGGAGKNAGFLEMLEQRYRAKQVEAFVRQNQDMQPERGTPLTKAA